MRHTPTLTQTACSRLSTARVYSGITCVCVKWSHPLSLDGNISRQQLPPPTTQFVSVCTTTTTTTIADQEFSWFWGHFHCGLLQNQSFCEESWLLNASFPFIICFVSFLHILLNLFESCDVKDYSSFEGIKTWLESNRCLFIILKNCLKKLLLCWFQSKSTATPIVII